MRYAIIENGKVVNIVEADEEFASQNGWKEAASAAIGDLWNAETGEFSKPVVPFDYAKAWEDIKAERDRRTQEGGYFVAGKWFHSDTFSRSQQLGLVMMGENVPAGIMWKTMDGLFIEITAALASSIFTSAVVSDAAIFEYAEALKKSIELADDPFSVNIYAGWPTCYLDVNK